MLAVVSILYLEFHWSSATAVRGECIQNITSWFALVLRTSLNMS